MERRVRHRQPKGTATDGSSCTPPRQPSTLLPTKHSRRLTKIQRFSNEHRGPFWLRCKTCSSLNRLNRLIAGTIALGAWDASRKPGLRLQSKRSLLRAPVRIIRRWWRDFPDQAPLELPIRHRGPTGGATTHRIDEVVQRDGGLGAAATACAHFVPQTTRICILSTEIAQGCIMDSTVGAVAMADP